jgi:hypothetical protein
MGKNDIDNAIINRNKKHFNQAQGTAPTTSPFIDLSGRNAENGITRMQNVSWSSYNKMTQTLYHQLIEKRLPPIDTTITSTQIKDAYKAWNEKTSTSPSGRHLGHYKVLLMPPGLTNTTQTASDTTTLTSTQCKDTEVHQTSTTTPKDYTTGIDYTNSIMNPAEGGQTITKNPINPTGDTIFQMMATIMNGCIYTRQPLERWLNVHCSMLEKKIGIDIIDKLRVTMLFESDMNLLYGLLWKRMNNNAEKYGAYNNNQWGHEKGASALT